jgi:16S rRNA (guanine966-N2)-methyltransferase
MRSRRNDLLIGFRPTSSKIISALISMIDFEGAKVIDIFAGSGRFGKAALENGASLVLFVERDRRLAKTLEDDLVKDSTCRILCMNAIEFLSMNILNWGTEFDLVFADPPFEMNVGNELLKLLSSSTLVKEETRFILQQFHKTPIPINSSWEMIDNRRYGEQRVVFFLFKGADIV